MQKFVSIFVITCFIVTGQAGACPVYAQSVSGLPTPGKIVSLSPAFEPILIKGLRVHPENPFKFDFILDQGDQGAQEHRSTGAQEQIKSQATKLIKYFLASLTIPEKDLWVNLSPYEKDRIIPDALGQTELGTDMLGQDYILKQLTASLIYPEKGLGKNFWDRVYAKARQMYGTTQVPVNTFNKVWIVADKAKVYVHHNTALVIAAHLKVMLEEDYLASSHQRSSQLAGGSWQEKPKPATYDLRAASSLGSQIVRQLILPALETEVNAGKNFACLRQIFYSMILATWYKKNLKEALLNQVYADKAKIKGIEASSLNINQIYQLYLKAYKKGVFNYIKEDMDAAGQILPRKYFSGGLVGLNRAQVVGLHDPDTVLFSKKAQNPLLMIKARMDPAMMSEINLNTNEPVLPQIERIPSLDLVTAAVYAQQFVERLSHQQPSDPEIQKAVKKFGKRDIILAIRDYFIEQWTIKGKRDTSRVSNKAIVKKATDWMNDVFDKEDPIYPHLSLLKQARLLVTGAVGTLGLPTAEVSLNYVNKVFSFQKVPVTNRQLQHQITLGREIIREDNIPIYGNLNNMEDLMSAIELMIKENQDQGPEYMAIVHLGGPSLTSMSLSETMAGIINLVNILISMHAKGIKKLLVVSSKMAHDIRQSQYAMEEYFKVKIARKFCMANAIKLRVILSPNVAGGFQLGEIVVGDQHMRLIPTLIKKIKDGTPFEMPAEADKIKVSIIDYTEFTEAVIRMLTTFFVADAVSGLNVDLVPKESYTLRQIVAFAQEFSKLDFVRQEGGKPLAVKIKQPNPDFLEDSTPVLSPKFAAKYGWEAKTTLYGIFSEAWRATLAPQDINDHAKPSTPGASSRLNDEAKGLEDVREVILNPILPLDDEDRLECLLGILAFSAKGDILKQLRKDLEGFDPDLEFNFIKRINKKDMLKKLEDYDDKIKNEKNDLYREHRRYMALIRRYWPPDQAMGTSAFPGGIDLNAQNLQMEINQEDKAAEIKFDPALIAEFKKGDFSGILPVIFDIKALPRNYFTKYLAP